MQPNQADFKEKNADSYSKFIPAVEELYNLDFSFSVCFVETMRPVLRCTWEDSEWHSAKCTDGTILHMTFPRPGSFVEACPADIRTNGRRINLIPFF